MRALSCYAFQWDETMKSKPGPESVMSLAWTPDSPVTLTLAGWRSRAGPPQATWDCVGTLRQQAGARGAVSAGCRSGSAGWGERYGWAKETSSPAAPISDLAKASKIVSAGSAADGLDAPSSCHAGRQDSWPGVRSGAVGLLKPSAPEKRPPQGRGVFVTTTSEWRVA